MSQFTFYYFFADFPSVVGTIYWVRRVPARFSIYVVFFSRKPLNTFGTTLYHVFKNGSRVRPNQYELALSK